MSFRRKIASFAAIVLLSALPIGAAQSAQAIPGGAVTVYKVVSKSLLSSNYTNYSNELARCNAATSGVTCSISQSVSATRTIGLDLGASRGVIATGLSISSASSTSISVTCNSPAMSAGQSFRAYPVGSRYSYKIQKRAVAPGSDTLLATSGTLYAFDPRTSGVTCGVY